ncbi:PASTA domain-containing protein [Streptomyces broussonetiae]|uniref:PASTA domain-containing protein n=1 Tax=Streptomyces broussonetiae TaxID=2686304 RepID=A0A6I6MR80_9ACTN|nr:PASTA domain-containing protein [Streptomyces broussonetiae]QHA02813.1 PASTA domain-containing protein [Streptomyces broussonetiae]
MISWGHIQVLLWLFLGALALIGVVLVIARYCVPSRSASADGIVRSWIALALVAGLLVFCAVAFAVRDANLRSTLIGALAAAAGSTIAFYFSGKHAEEARQDVLSAAFGGQEVVPDLTECTEQQASEILGKTSLQLDLAPGSGPSAPPATITGQDPARGSTAPRGTTVKVTFAAGPVPGATPEGGPGQPPGG